MSVPIPAPVTGSPEALLADRLLDSITVLHNADQASPGKWVNLSVVPQLVQQPLGFASRISGTVTGLAPGIGNLTADLSPLLQTARLNVGFEVTLDDMPVEGRDFISIPEMVSQTPVEKLTEASFLLRPPVADSCWPMESFHYKIVVSVSASVQIGTNPLLTTDPPRRIEIPVDMPPLDIPAVLLLCNRPDFSPDADPRGMAVSVVVRSGSELLDLGAVTQALRTVNSTLRALNTILDVGSTFFETLDIAVQAISNAPLVYLHQASDRNTADDKMVRSDFLFFHRDLDDDVGGVILIGATGTTARMYNETDFEDFKRDVVAKEMGNFSLVGLERKLFTSDDDRGTESVLLLPSGPPAATTPGQADISLSMRPDQGPAVRIDVTNNGPDPATGVVADISLRNLRVPPASANTVRPSTGKVTVSASGSSLRWAIGNLSPHTGANLTLTYQSLGNALIKAFARARQFDPNIFNNGASLSIPA
ncbi:hypothetical protein [Streptomyces hesseae]|uniref:DUF11 domain-containing protein n=1 Tax=Streptomyces hesseae TaxID=3075519 RepID=A0ABU2SJ25_9ACTN|nr:hypothetical protein [Streptomyces sp. DSM 40473]MDT0447780.1 hypothetical protein [Streptomyces sp. DSM 40473]